MIPPRPAFFAGLALDRPVIMGIVNVTPDSFSDGGNFIDSELAIEHGRRMAEAGADIIDIGGESTRPGAAAVSVDDELDRVLPVVNTLASDGIKVSIDTRKAPVMKAALTNGAAMVNDVTALTGDTDSIDIVADSGAPVILMHMQGDPANMQDNPYYNDTLQEIYDYLEERIEACDRAGIGRERIAVDPGIGFGKTVEHNLEIIRHLDMFGGLGCAIVLGVSRKSFIGAASKDQPPPTDRLAGSLAAMLAGVDNGADIVRVHDVAETRQALDIWRAINGVGAD